MENVSIQTVENSESNIQVHKFITWTSLLEDNHVGEEYSYHLKGKERQEVKKELLHIMPNAKRQMDIKEADPHLFRDGNWRNIRSVSVYQKARSEAKSDLDFSKDSYLDLVFRAKNFENQGIQYLQYPSMDTFVALYSKEQINILITEDKIVGYFDATGSVCRSLKSGRTFYYAMVVNKQNKIVPVCELLTSQHDSSNLSCFLSNLNDMLL